MIGIFFVHSLLLAPWTRCYLTIASEVNVTIGKAPGMHLMMSIIVSGTILTFISIETTTVQIKNNLAPASINNTQSSAVVKAMLPSLSPPTLAHNAAPMSFVEAVTNAGRPIHEPVSYLLFTLMAIMYFSF